MILNEENSNSSSSSSAATTTNTKSPMMSKLKTHNSTPKLAHKSMIYPKADASKTVNEAMRMMNGSDNSLKNNSSSICSSISSSSSTSSSSSSTNSSIYQNHNNHTHNNPDCYIHAPKSSQTLIKYVHPTTTSVVSGGVAVVKQKSLSPANICLSKSSHGRSNGDATNGNTSAAVNPNSVTYRHKSVNVIERTPQIDETTNNPMKLVYNYNANRLSSYDNDVFSNFCSSGQHMTDPGVIINDEMMPTMTTNTLAAVNREQEYMNTMSMLPMKQRAASQSISTQTNKSTNGGTNVFSRALNFARQKASPSVNRAGNGTEQGNSKSSSSSTWRSKLTKYLTQSSSPPPPSSSVPPSSSSPSTASSSQHHQRRKRANRRKTIQTSMELNPHRSKLIYHPSSAHNYHHHHYNDFDDEDMDDEPYQDGCDILLDENDDIYSSYHLSRRQTATTNNLITATIKQPHHYNYQHHQQQHNQQQSKLLSISSGLLSLSSSASSTTSSAANNNNNNHNSVAPTTNALSSASVASSSAASDFIGVVAAANSRQSPQIVDLTSKSTRSPSQNFSKSSKQRINNGFNSLRRILKLNNNNPTSNHYHNNNSSNQTLKEPIALNTPPLNHRLAKRTSTLDYSKSMMSTHQPQLQQQQQQQQQSTSKNMFTMTLNRHMSGACGSSASCEEHKSTMVKKKDKLKKQMSFSAVSSSMKVDMIANNRCATSAAVAARSAHSMSLTDDALSHVNNTNQAQNSGNSSRVMNMLRVYKNVLSKISRTPSHCQTPAATSTSTTPASSNTLSLMNCANPRSSHHNHNSGTTPGSKEGQNHPITNSVVSFTSAVNLKPNSSSCLQIQMPIATKQLAAQLNCSGRTNGGGSGGNNTSTNSSSSSSSILFPVMVAPTLPYQQPIQIVSQHHSVENNNKLVSLANSPKTFATIHNPSSAHMMSESSNGTATLYENNTGGYRSVSVHIEATSTRRKNSNTKSPSYDVEEDLACDLEVASFFDKKRRGDVEYGAEEEYDDDDGDVGGAQEEPMMGDNDDYYSTTTYEPPAIINGVGGGGENGMLNYNLDYDDDDFNQTEDDEEHDIDDDDDDGQDEEDSQNLDYLVRQLVAEASLSNLNINMDSRKQQQPQKNQLYENRSSFPDLNRSEFVDDDNLDSSSGENHQQQQRRQVVMDSESELSLVEVEIPSGIMTTTTAASQQQRRRPSSSYSRLESLTSKLNANVTQPSQPAPPIITDSPHSQSGAVKLEKRIRLNYRKQPNLNNVNLLNFGTLC